MTKDMTSGSPMKLILAFSIPILLGNLFQQFYSMVDTAIVGKYIGVEALAAVGSTGSLTFLIVDFALGLTAGFAVPIAQTFGANDYKKMRHYVAMSIYLCVFLTVILTLLSVFMTRPLLELLHTPSDIIDDAYAYLVVIFAGLGTTIFYNMIAGILRSIGDSRTPLYFLIVSSIINIILDLVFILKFNSGVAGAAYATIIAQGISGLLCLWVAAKRYTLLHLSKEDFKYENRSILKLVGIGLPMALQYSITAVGCMIVQAAVNSLGSITVAAFTAASKVEQLAMQPFKTLGMTMVTYTGQNLGAGKPKRIQSGVRSGMLLCVICAVIGGFGLYFYGETLSGFFVSNTSTSAAVIADAQTYLNTAMVYFIPLGAIFVYRNSLQGMGEGLITMLAGIIELLSRTAVAALFTASLGYTAICYASPAAWVSAGVFLVVIYLIKLRKMLKNHPTPIENAHSNLS